MGRGLGMRFILRIGEFLSTMSGERRGLMVNRGIYGNNFQPQDLPADRITHVLYSFADIASNGEV